jgi:hypothetical protein
MSESEIARERRLREEQLARDIEALRERLVACGEDSVDTTKTAADLRRISQKLRRYADERRRLMARHEAEAASRAARTARS